MPHRDTTSALSCSTHREAIASRSLAVRWGDHDLELLADRAVWWRQRHTLIIADPHFGKAASFRAKGVPVPEGTTQHNLQRLTNLVQATLAKRLIVLGDFFHARDGLENETLRLIEAWRSAHAMLGVINVRGNHDAHAGDPPCDWNIQCIDEPFLDDCFAFRHEPVVDESRFTFSGHVHPGAVLRDVDHASVRLPCFHFAPALAILPAFGAFTGLHPIRPKRGDRIMVTVCNGVVEVPIVPRK